MSTPHNVTELCYSHGCPDHQEIPLPIELLRWWIDAAEGSSDMGSFSSLIAMTKRYFENQDIETVIERVREKSGSLDLRPIKSQTLLESHLNRREENE